MKKILFLLFLLPIAFISFSQNAIQHHHADSTNVVSKEKDSKWSFHVGLDFSSIPTYKISGVDTSFVNSLSVSPSIGIKYNSFGITYSPNFVVGGSAPGLFMHIVTIGFEQYDKDDWTLVADYSHLFLTKNTSVPATPLINEIHTSAIFKKSVVRPGIAADIGFGNLVQNNTSSGASDVSVSAGIGHSFSSEASGFSFVPSLYLNAGTNQYFSYLTTSKYISNSNGLVKYIPNKGKGKRNGNSTTTAQSKSSFGLTNLELDLEFEYEKNSFSIYPNASLYVPVGKNSGSGLDGSWQISFQYSF